ncbi:hypothetical protein [Streptosporangium sp. NPDC002607]
MREWKMRRVGHAGRAVVCLLAASVCELVIAAVAFVYLIVLHPTLGESIFADRTAGLLPSYVWAYTAAGVITLTVAVLAWRRGGTAGVQAVAALVLVPYTAFYVCFGLLMPVLMDDYWAESWYPCMVLWLAGAAGLLYLAGVALLFLAAPNPRAGEGREGGTPDELAADAVIDAQGEDEAVRGWRKRRAGRAVMCLLAASVGELAIVASALVLLPPLQQELTASYKPGYGVDYSLENTVDHLQWYMWSYAAAGVITLTVAALAWRRGGTARARTVAALGLAPYTAFYLLFGPLLGSLEEEHVGWYSDMVLWLAGAAGLLYLAGVALLFLAAPSPRAGEGREGGTPDELAADTVANTPDTGAAVRGRRRWRAGGAVLCLLAASVGELVIAVGALVLLPPLQQELTASYGVDPLQGRTVDHLQWYMWGYAAAGVITLAVAALVWRRGGTAGARAVAVLSLAPCTMLYLLLGLLVGLLGEEHVGWYSDMVLWLAGVAGLFYLAGVILIFLAGGAHHGRRLHAAENTGVAS